MVHVQPALSARFHVRPLPEPISAHNRTRSAILVSSLRYLFYPLFARSIVGPAGRSNLISRGQSGLKNESQSDAPSRPYPRSSWSPARYLQAYLNASCTTCSPVAGPNFLPCVSSCVPYKFLRNPSLCIASLLPT
jgi:hypothetical protein